MPRGSNFAAQSRNLSEHNDFVRDQSWYLSTPQGEKNLGGGHVDTFKLFYVVPVLIHSMNNA